MHSGTLVVTLSTKNEVRRERRGGEGEGKYCLCERGCVMKCSEGDNMGASALFGFFSAMGDGHTSSDHSQHHRTI